MSDESFQDLLKDIKENFVCLHVNEFTAEAFKDFHENFFKAESSGQTVIPVFINSIGGEVNILFAMIDLFNSSKLPICTIAIGSAQSCGADLLAAGTKGYRYAAPLASIMVHDGDCIVGGKASEVKLYVEEELRSLNTTFKLLDKHCSQIAGYWKDVLKEKMNADLYMNAKQAKKHGLIDFIRLPRFEPEISVKTNIV